ncbi:MAG: hypothetical protein EXR77_02845 [Myxococcales bacterium]|nr:hypothetical protein [Myxococcales bacterium]
MATDPYRAKAMLLRQTVLAGHGVVAPAVRSAAAANAAIADEQIAQYVAQIHRDALRVTDASVDALKQNHTEDALFELTVAAATGAGMQRLDILLALLEDECA